MPLRPDKLVLCHRLLHKQEAVGYRPIGGGKKKKYIYHRYSAAEVWRWMQNPVTAPWETWEHVLVKCCANTPDSDLPETPGEADKRQRRQKKQARDFQVASPDRAAGPFKGRWLRLMRETFLEGIEPANLPVLFNTVVMCCRVGLDMDEDDTALVLDDLRLRLDDEDAALAAAGSYTRERVDKTIDILLAEPLKYQRDPEQSRAKWQAVGAYLEKIGWDISDPDTWVKAERASRPQLPLRWTRELDGLAAALSIQEHCDVEKARPFLERLANHLLANGEVAHSFMQKLLYQAQISTGERCCRRANRVIKLLAGVGFMHKRAPHCHDEVTGEGHGAFFVLDPNVEVLDQDAAASIATTGTEKKRESAITSLPLTFPPLSNDLVMEMEVRCRRCDQRVRERKRQLFARKWAA
jgi:hypothetical protein